MLTTLVYVILTSLFIYTIIFVVYNDRPNQMNLPMTMQFLLPIIIMRGWRFTYLFRLHLTLFCDFSLLKTVKSRSANTFLQPLGQSKKPTMMLMIRTILKCLQTTNNTYIIRRLYFT